MKKTLFILIFSIAPISLYARGGDIIDLIYFNIYPILKTIQIMLFSVAFIVFVWGIIKYILSEGEKDTKESIGIITFGVIAITVLIGVWGIVYFLQYNFGINPVIEPGETRLLDIIMQRS